MKKFAETLKHNTISSLINSKPIRRDKFIFLGEEDNVRTALIAFSKNGINTIPLKGRDVAFLGFIGISNLIKFIFSYDPNVDISTLLEIKLRNIPNDYIIFLMLNT